MLRARALEQALRMLIDAAVQTACKIAEDGDRRWHVVDLVCATNDAEKLLAVDPPPSGASPQAETSDDLSELWRQELYPHVEPDTFKRFLCDLTAEGWDDVRKEVFALQSIVDSRPAPVSPVEPEPPYRETPAGDRIFRHTCSTPEDDGECMACSQIDCPDREPLHYHHDGCPCCSQKLPVEPEPCVWRDISTAPKVHPLQGGSDLLLAWVAPGIGEWVVVVGCWRDGWWSGSDEAYPTLWAPVPRLPGAPLKVARWRKAMAYVAGDIAATATPEECEQRGREIDAIDEDYEMACRTNQALSARLAAVEAERDKAQRALATAYLKARRQASVCEPNEDQFAGAMAVVAAAFPNTRVEATAVRIAKPEEPTELVVAVKRRAERAEAERDRLKAALERLRDCDWTIGRGDRMDAVRDIARAALTPQGQSTDGETR